MLNKHHNLGNVENFLAMLDIHEEGHNIRGITWYELYILYRHRGFPKPLPDHARKGISGETAYKQICEFRIQVRMIINKCLYASQDKGLFKPAAGTKDALIGVGIKGKHASLSFNVSIDESERQAVAFELCRLNRTISIALAHKFLQGDVCLLSQDLKLKGKASWDSAIRVNPQYCIQVGKWHNNYRVNVDTLEHATYYNCPKCRHAEPSSLCAFQLKDLDYSIKCITCKHSTPVLHWKCECEVLWHGCSIHRVAAQARTELPRRETASRGTSTNIDGQAKAKKRRANARIQFDDMLVQDTVREDRKRKRKAWHAYP